MKRLLYIFSGDITNDSNGVSNKVRGQRYAFRKLGFEVSVAGFSSDGVYIVSNKGKRIDIKSKHSRLRHFDQPRLIKHYFVKFGFEYVYLRYPSFTPDFLHLIKNLKNHGVTIFLEVATYPIPRTIFRKLIEMIGNADKYVSKYVDEVLYIGNPTETIYGHPAKLIPNGIPGDDPQFFHRNHTEHQGEIHLFAAATMYSYQGFERIIDSLYVYYELHPDKKGTVKIVLAGDGEARHDYEELVQRYHLNDDISFPGCCNAEQMKELYDDADVGFSALGDSLEECSMASKLKVKEYFQYALPYVYVTPEIDVPDDFEFSLQVSDKGQIDMQNIIDFVERNRNIGDKEVEERMHAFGRTHFLWENILYNNLFK